MGAVKTQVREPKPKRIIRSSHNDQSYFLMVRSTAQDDRLSWSARGMLAYLLSKPDDWTIDIKDLQQGCGRDKVYALLNELIKYRYIARIKVTGDKHQIESVDYYVYECPLPENTEEEKPLPDLPYTEKPDTENTDSYILEKEENTDIAEPPKSVQSAAPKPKKEKKPRDRDLLFDIIALGSFHVEKVPRSMGGKIGRIKSELLEVAFPDIEPTPEDITQMVTDLTAMFPWYKKGHNGLDAPAGALTINKYLIEYRQTIKPVKPRETFTIVEPEIYQSETEAA